MAKNTPEVMQEDKKVNELCENFARKESTKLFQFYHEELPHGSQYLHKTTFWNMRDLERLTKVCKESKCAFILRNEYSVYVFRDD